MVPGWSWAWIGHVSRAPGVTTGRFHFPAPRRQGNEAEPREGLRAGAARSYNVSQATVSRLLA